MLYEVITPSQRHVADIAAVVVNRNNQGRAGDQIGKLDGGSGRVDKINIERDFLAELFDQLDLAVSGQTRPCREEKNDDGNDQLSGQQRIPHGVVNKWIMKRIELKRSECAAKEYLIFKYL